MNEFIYTNQIDNRLNQIADRKKINKTNSEILTSRKIERSKVTGWFERSPGGAQGVTVWQSGTWFQSAVRLYTPGHGSLILARSVHLEPT